MDLEKNLQRVEGMLIGICGCTYKEAIFVCEEMIHILKLKDEKQQKNIKKTRDLKIIEKINNNNKTK